MPKVKVWPDLSGQEKGLLRAAKISIHWQPECRGGKWEVGDGDTFTYDWQFQKKKMKKLVKRKKKIAIGRKTPADETHRENTDRPKNNTPRTCKSGGGAKGEAHRDKSTWSSRRVIEQNQKKRKNEKRTRNSGVIKPERRAPEGKRKGKLFYRVKESSQLR